MASNNYVRQFCNRSAFVRLQLAAAVRYVPRAKCQVRHLPSSGCRNICQAANKLTAIKVVIS